MMKLILEEELSELSSLVVENDTASGKKKEYFLSGVFSTAGVKNGNGRVYPRNIWEREVALYQNKINENHITTLGEWEHPARADIDPMKAVIKIVELKLEGDYVYGKAKILDNPEGERLKVLIDEGIKIDISSRGVGSVGKNGIVEEFKLITYDLVSKASNPGSQLVGIVEGLSYMVNESGDIIEYKIDENNKYVKAEDSVDLLSEAKSTIDYKKFHSGVKNDIQIEILDNVFNNADFKKFIEDNDKDLNDERFMKLIITNILTSIKKVKKGDNYKITSVTSFGNPVAKTHHEIKFSKDVPVSEYDLNESEPVDLLAESEDKISPEVIKDTLLKEFKKLLHK